MKYHGTIEFGGVSIPFTVEAEDATDAAYLVSDCLVDMVQPEVITVDKITTGIVVQTFDTETGECVAQRFVAGDEVEFADPSSGFIETLDTLSLYYPFDMVQPEGGDN